ncbi:MAG: sialidase family protein [Saprospiraceae bacterium]
MKNSLIVLMVLFSTSVGLYSQNNVIDALKHTLEEKMFLKLNSVHHQSEDKSVERRDFDNDKLVADNNLGVESELFAAINPADSNNMVVATIHFSNNPALYSPLSISVYYTKDFGNTWTKSSFNGVSDISGLVAGGGDPVLAFDANGNLHLTYIVLEITNFITFEAKESVFHAISQDGGVSWTKEAYFVSSEFDVTTFDNIDYFFDKQWMASDLSLTSPYLGNTYMAYVLFDLTNGGEEKLNIKVNTIKNGNTEFQNDAVTIGSDSFYFVQFSSIDVDKDGNIAVGFVGSYDALSYYIYNSMSYDGGASFSEPNIVSTFIYPGYSEGDNSPDIVGVSSDRYYPCPYTAIDKSGTATDGRIYMTWTAPGLVENSESGYDIYLSYSDDKGASWSERLLLSIMIFKQVEISFILQSMSILKDIL